MKRALLLGCGLLAAAFSATPSALLRAQIPDRPARPDRTSLDKAGPEKGVGFRVLERLDTARSFPPFPRGRPVQIAFWYPAASSSPRMAYRDYVLLADRETSFAPKGEAREREVVSLYKAWLAKPGVSAADADALLSTRMAAARDSAALPGRFPLVLIAPGNDHSGHDQAALAESLAGRGFAVAAVPSPSRIAGRAGTEADIAAHAEALAADLAFAVRILRAEPAVRPGPYGIAAHGSGARGALLLAMRDPDAAALVSLDGAIGSRSGRAQFEKTKGFDPKKATAPILHFFVDAAAPDLDLLRSFRGSDRWLVKVDGLRHIHFTTLGWASRVSPAVRRVTGADARTDTAWDGVAEATSSFLDRFAGALPAERKTAPAAGGKPAVTGWTPPASPFLHPEAIPAGR